MDAVAEEMTKKDPTWADPPKEDEEEGEKEDEEAGEKKGVGRSASSADGQVPANPPGGSSGTATADPPRGSSFWRGRGSSRPFEYFRRA